MLQIMLNFKFLYFGLIIIAQLLTIPVCAEQGLGMVGIYDTPNNQRILNYKGSNTLHCNITGSYKSEDYTFQWFRGGGTNQKKIEPKEDEPNFAIKDNDLIIRNVNDEILKDQFTCALVSKAPKEEIKASATFHLLGKPTTKIVSQGTFIQGHTILLECQFQGYPKPDSIEWRYENRTFVTSIGRFKVKDNLEKGLPSYYLQIDEAELTDRGEYACKAHNIVNSYMNVSDATIFVRVKDKYAALWPFIGICVEVVVLCAIIFVYERKRNKAEMEESDTDQSPEQKNTPDHGKESVRQRK